MTTATVVANPAPASAGAGPIDPAPRLLWGDVVKLLGCGSFELNRLVREQIAPPPVRVDGVTFWWEDELARAHAEINKALVYWRSRKAAGPRRQADPPRERAPE